MNNEINKTPEAAVPANQSDATDNSTDPTVTNEQAQPSADASDVTPPAEPTRDNAAQPDNTDNVSSRTPDVQQQEPAAISPAVVACLLELLSKATKSAYYMSNPKRITTLEEALNIPVSDDKSFQQFFTHSEKDLLADSYRNARKNSVIPVEVTNAQIMAEAQDRYVKKHGKRAVVNEEFEI